MNAHHPIRPAWMALLVGLALGLGSLLASATASADSAWLAYQTRFITPEGRVVDTGNGNISHSEGQGWGMLLALAHDDRATFRRLWQWTRQHLSRPDDALFAWRYEPLASPPVADTNNASDGDLFIAWALQLAAERWQQRGYASASRAIREAIAARLVRQAHGMTLLLPGANGFAQGEALDLNLSYWFMPALVDFAAREPQGPWQGLIDSGQRLLDEARFGRYRLPTDWIRLTPEGELAPSPEWPPRFGFDAVRIPLYFRWAGLSHAEGLGSIQAFWQDPAYQPPAAWIDVFSEERAPYLASRGVRAIAGLADSPPGPAPVNAAQLAEQDYYSATLLLLARLARGSQE